MTVSGFWIDKYQVTNRQFQAFVEATGYVTFAEKAPKAEDYPDADPAMLVPGSAVFVQPDRPVNLRTVCWWAYVPRRRLATPRGAQELHRRTRGSPGRAGRARGRRGLRRVGGRQVPAHGGRGGSGPRVASERGPSMPGAASSCRAESAWPIFWNGQFPHENLKAHPPGPEAVGSYPPNDYGLYDMIGNVWEWTEDWYLERHPENPAKACCTPRDPVGGTQAASISSRVPASERKPRKVLKGGSFLCAPNHCSRYRPAARHPEDIDSSTNHIGFRTVVRNTVSS